MSIHIRPTEVENVFFEAMKAGWAGNVKKTSIPDLPGSKVIPFELGDFKVLDYYFVTPDSDRSAGTTTIWHRNIPVWTMSYGGWYAEFAIPFLKECLIRAYVKERRFYGGRGPEFVQGERFTYFNMVDQGSDFSNFGGKEEIYDTSEQCFGFHWYRGMTLLEK